MKLRDVQMRRPRGNSAKARADRLDWQLEQHHYDGAQHQRDDISRNSLDHFRRNQNDGDRQDAQRRGFP